MARNLQIQLLRGTFANIPPLASGELYYATDTETLYVGPTPTAIGPGSAGGLNKVQVLVDFGYESGEEGDLARLTVTGQSWVTASSVIVCSAAALSTANHDPEDGAIEGITAYAENLVAGVGFDIVAKACGDSGSTFGQYVINAIGQ